MKLLPLLYSYATAILIGESQWSLSNNCQGSPTSIYFFNINDTKDFKPNKENDWPTFYEFTALEYTIGFCGNLIPKNYNNCCYSSLDINLSKHYHSGSPFLYENDSNINQLIPNSINNQKYCKILPNHHTMLKTFHSIYFIADQSCIDDYFKCSDTGLFSIYTDKNCQGNVYSKLLTNTISNYTDDFGNYDGELMTITNGTRKFIWTAFTPSAYLIPNTNSIWDVLNQICMVSTILWFVLGLIFTIGKYLKQSNIFSLLLIFTQIIWIVDASLWLYYINQNFSLLDLVYLTQQIDGILFGLCTLSTVYITAYQLARFNIPYCPVAVIKPICVVLFLLHVLLFGGNYFQFCANNNIVTCIDKTFMFQWRSLSTFWIALMFIWDVIPIILAGIYLKAHKLRQDMGRDIKITFWGIVTNMDIVFVSLFLVHVFLAILYTNNGIIINYTNVLASDRASLCFQSIQRSLIGLHSGVNIAIWERLILIMYESRTSEEQPTYTISLSWSKGFQFSFVTPNVPNSSPEEYLPHLGYHVNPVDDKPRVSGEDHIQQLEANTIYQT
ncbi:hypothetical protein BC833DRAFT_597884 [Globomyces pollinis-pini]|nr:hypothetical protein BC833DRAFT_597884 [Globomyces pollinis-pini]